MGATTDITPDEYPSKRKARPAKEMTPAVKFRAKEKGWDEIRAKFEPSPDARSITNRSNSPKGWT